MVYKKLKDRTFDNPEVKIEYGQLVPEFALTNTLISMRQKADLALDEIAKHMGTQKVKLANLSKIQVIPVGKYSKITLTAVVLSYQRTLKILADTLFGKKSHNKKLMWDHFVAP